MRIKPFLCFVLFMLFWACDDTNPKEVKKMIVQEIAFEGAITLDTVARLLDEHSQTHYLNEVNWEAFPYQPKVGFKIAHSNNQIWLKYEVEEEYILGEKTEPNSFVFRDSCVEFFFDPLSDGNYYNFEINCIGTTLLAHGPGRRPRQYASDDVIQNTLKRASSLGTQPFSEKDGGHSWEITIVIPAETLTQNPDIQLKGLKSRANFYKCADGTSKKHYLSWNPIQTKKPDFHRPEYFGELVFE
ncbi:carbohydrate-binding family 9-like protein [Muricauda sp. 2012CJ35-5]|uniref:Carbohydrate-binding family 9-like protein n=1 Tax=Flagellimonas spongiicola TaxID=2942208 RepID=A0ABT0PUP7_9FLAO|nr:carbohydrate-binding family 9-like protein [Allomuricauda spongiicola]MCL6275097.1 carbohydrate-binding family 9-like protein [Allomuricauda spongiicola]